MTEKKRYTIRRWHDDNAIYENNELFAIVDVRMQAKKIAHRLNEQEEEISNLQLIIEVNGKAYRKSVKEYEEFIEELEQENEQLKHEINYLEDRLDDCVCLKKENKDLKEENLELSQKILKGLFEDENDELRKENKKLKEELEWCRMTVDGLKGDVE